MVLPMKQGWGGEGLETESVFRRTHINTCGEGQGYSSVKGKQRKLLHGLESSLHIKGAGQILAKKNTGAFSAIL